ncbi:hypothetical protein GCM10025868_01890 [Angustibacter aerolatus]|uniref:EAL domain-containing protein n=1 Tax=Angustibacter aerolatus TaxID=1162965 RepID=A0ABQ6JBW1_9ACTN|nr:EAL domain-containing protein [Angustibacter aerolatus]GMA84939.1 hypothetical protein GCM10025868_01890 [Angustibacter aerolatus]
MLGMLDSASDAAIVRSVVELGHNLGMSVVAEGVETPEALQRLRSMGCDVTQGYYFSRPLPAPALQAWLGHRAADAHVATLLTPST